MWLGGAKMNSRPNPMSSWFKWVCWIGGSLFLCLHALWLFMSFPMVKAGAQIISEKAPKDASSLFLLVERGYLPFIEFVLGVLAGIAIVRWPGIRRRKVLAQEASVVGSIATSEPVSPEPAPVVHHPVMAKNRRWSSCNIMQFAPDGKKLWHFNAKGGGFVLGREQRVPHAEKLPAKHIAKSWSTLWQPKLNVAWLPPEKIFLRVVELPASNAEEMVSMVELQLEKLSPMPVGQIVWTMHLLGTRTAPAKGDQPAETLQTVVVVIAERAVVEAFLGKLEQEGFLADRLEVPMLDQLEAITPTADSAWVIPQIVGGQSAALVAWWVEGALRNLSFVALPPTGDRAAELKHQLSLLFMAGEVEGWLAGNVTWQLVADPVSATEWEGLLRAALDEPVKILPPPSTVDLAGRTAKRAAAAANTNLLPEEFRKRYHDQFVERLWLRAVGFVVALYIIGVAFYFCGVTYAGYRATNMESQVAAISDDYTNAVQLKARFAILQQREHLKFAALDCWQLVAKSLPAGLTVQRFNFTDGQKLNLSGVCTPDQMDQITGNGQFYDSLRKSTDTNGQAVFNANPDTADQLQFSSRGNQDYWSFGLELMNSEGVP